jgi:NAD(P)-dependent dehydrogenase (short-subunit alcohol dehydrogenase family)
MERIRRQFETNVFGLVRLTQLVLPGMRRQRWGKIVNLSSMGGKLTFPGGGVYHATKHAVEALSDALRFEVAGFGIDVVVIEPGLIRTSFGEAAVGGMAGVLKEAPAWRKGGSSPTDSGTLPPHSVPATGPPVKPARPVSLPRRAPPARARSLSSRCRRV